MLKPVLLPDNNVPVSLSRKYYNLSYYLRVTFLSVRKILQPVLLPDNNVCMSVRKILQPVLLLESNMSFCQENTTTCPST